MELSQKSDKYYATIATVTFHALLLLLFILYKIITPLPPFDPTGGGGLGVELNFGDSEDGMGLTNPDQLSAPNKPQPAPQSQKAPLLTSEIEEDNFVETPKPKKERVIKELKREDNGPKITKQEDPAPVVKKEALYPGKKGGNEGNTGKAGNQGQQDGTDPFSSVYKGKAGSGGEGGEGGGKGKGKGPGEGDFDGIGKSPSGGPKAYLVGGKAVNLSKPAYTSENSGIVVVDIIVNRDGQVIKAIAGARGTRIQDANLFQQAEAAARKSKFSANPDGPEKRIGTITYNFIRN
jgi:hypothetical protein